MENKTFAELGLIDPLLRALEKEKHLNPTPIQVEAIPHLLDGRDLLGSAQTGTGKTAAFSLPILQKLTGKAPSHKRSTPRALIITPTRELANQVSESIRSYGRFLKLTHAVVYGGVPVYSQVRAMPRNLDILVATPGRLLDLMRQRHIFLDGVEMLVLDEADRMLDMGFIHDIKTVIAAIPEKRQTLFFSATMNGAAKQLADNLLTDPVYVTVNPVSSTADRVDQKVLFVGRHNKEALLLSLLEDKAVDRVLVFTRTKHRANKLSEKLNTSRVSAEAIHGNKSQGARMQALRKFSTGRARVLVATDVASRGIDVKGVTHVINFEMPNEPENYVHRIGRTARAGAAGVAISFCDTEELSFLNDIERITKVPMPVDTTHPYHCETTANAPRRGKGGSAGKGGFKRGGGGFHNRRPQSRRFGGRSASRA